MPAVLWSSTEGGAGGCEGWDEQALMNLSASSLVLISLSQSFNAASVVIQLFWFVVSIVSIFVRLRRNRPAARDATRLRRLT